MQRRLRGMGYTVWRQPAVRQEDGVYALGVEQALLGMPVFGGTLTFSYQNGTLRAADGVFTRIRVRHPRLGGSVHLLRRRADADFGEPRRARLGRQPDHRHAAGLSALRDGHLGPPLHAGLARGDGHGSLLRQRHHARGPSGRMRHACVRHCQILIEFLGSCCWIVIFLYFDTPVWYSKQVAGTGRAGLRCHG